MLLIDARAVQPVRPESHVHSPNQNLQLYIQCHASQSETLDQRQATLLRMPGETACHGQSLHQTYVNLYRHEHRYAAVPAGHVFLPLPAKWANSTYGRRQVLMAGHHGAIYRHKKPLSAAPNLLNQKCLLARHQYRPLAKNQTGPPGSTYCKAAAKPTRREFVSGRTACQTCLMCQYQVAPQQNTRLIRPRFLPLATAS